MLESYLIHMVALLLVGGMGCVVGGTPASRPNIVVIYGDDVGYGDVGCYGAIGVKTPNVDRLARDGLRFTDGYATSGTCTPSRFSLLTGKYAFREEGTGVLPGNAPLVIRPGRETLAAVLKRAGYRTGVIGKWHLGLGDPGAVLDWNGEIKPGPLEVGFDYSFVIPATPDRVPCVYVQNHRVFKLDPADPLQVSYQQPFPGEPTGRSGRGALKMDWSHGHNDAVINGIGRIGYMTGGKAAQWKDEQMGEVLTEQAVSFIKQAKDHAFFLYFASHNIHVPRVPNQQFVGKSGMGPRGDAMVEFDHAVGRILATLDELKLTDQTLVIFSSDNGPALDDGYKDEARKKLGAHRPGGPLRAGKYSSFEGGTRLPFITCWPGQIKPGVSSALVSQVDLLASIAALTGQAFNTHDASDSENILPALLGRSEVGRQSLVEQGMRGDLALRAGNWKYLPPGRVRDGLGPWTNVQIAEPGLLFDLSNDPAESHDLASDYPEKVAELRRRLADISKDGHQ